MAAGSEDKQLGVGWSGAQPVETQEEQEQEEQDSRHSAHSCNWFCCKPVSISLNPSFFFILSSTDKIDTFGTWRTLALFSETSATEEKTDICELFGI